MLGEIEGESEWEGVSKRKNNAMSKKYPECPLFNHLSCKDIDNPKICAIVRKDKVCVKKKLNAESKKKKD